MRRRADGEQEQEYGFRQEEPQAEPHAELHAELHAEHHTEFEDEAATSPHADPPTVTAPRGRAHVVSIDFDDETQGRIDADATPPRTVPFGGAHVHHEAREQHLLREPAEMDVAYEDLPSLEMRRPFDSYDAEAAERDAAAQLRAARESMRKFQSARPAKASPEQRPAERPAEREASGPRQRPQEYAAAVPSYDEDSSWDEPAIPPPPPVPREAQMPQGFVVGVQPIRTPQPYPTPAPAYAAPMQAPVAHAPVAHYPAPPYAMQAAQMQAAQMQAAQMQAAQMQAAQMQAAQMQAAQMQAAQMQAAQHMAVAPGTHAMAPPPYQAYPAQQPQAAQSLQVPAQVQPSPLRVGRFAWFFFGAVFGICFAFFATGYFSPGAFAKRDEAFPPAAPPPATVTVMPVSPVVTAPPPPVVIAPPPSAFAPASAPPPAFAPAPPPTYASPPAFAPAPPPTYASPPAASPAMHAKVAPPPAVRPQHTIARRPPPASAGDDEAPAPAKKSGGDSGNLLSDALSP